MKLVIDIPEKTYTDIQEHKRYTDFTILDLIKAIRTGTVLSNIKQGCNERESEFMRKARLSMQESAYLDQGITQC